MEEYGEVGEGEIPITPETVMMPVKSYAVTKFAQDLTGYVYFRSYGTNVIRTRPFDHERPRDRGLPGAIPGRGRRFQPLVHACAAIGLEVSFQPKFPAVRS